MQDHQNTIIKLQNVSFSYNNELVLKDISLQIHKGDYLGIVGPNGGGKSTLLKIILGLLKPQKGTVELTTQKIGVVMQKVNFDFNFPATSKEVVAMGLYSKKGVFRSMGREDWIEVENALNRLISQHPYMPQYQHHYWSKRTSRLFLSPFVINELPEHEEVLLRVSWLYQAYYRWMRYPQLL